MSAPSMRDLLVLTKPRIVAAGALAALAGYLAPLDHVRLLPLLEALAAIGGITAAAGILNQVLERDIDARMPRTADRPLPAGRVGVRFATLLGCVLAAASLALSAWRINGLTTALMVFAFVSYLFVYTPLKRHTTLNTFVGAVPGALPPVLGWTAATGDLGRGAYALFAIMFLWQLPHFLAIAWLYRRDYELGGLKMLPERDPDGALVSRQICVHAVSLCLVALLPFRFQMAGPVYLVGSLVLGLGFAIPAFRFWRERSDALARQVMRASLIYLPGILCLLALKA
ncbi:MAG: protoheme IX farnesyltransferase [Planctomycetes bacterium]|nr:protoheme IX farnesyltransferase [Planctomycetota bacterium]